MTKSRPKKTSSTTIGIVIIFILFSGIIFLIILSKKQTIPNSTNSIELFKKDSAVPKTKKVNTDIKLIKNSDYKYGNLNENFKTYFKEKINKDQDNDIKVEKDNSSLTFQVINRLILSKTNDKGQDITVVEKDHDSLNFYNIKTITSPSNQKNRIRYSGIYQQDQATIDVEYSIENNKLVEEFILNQPLGFPTIYQKIKLDNVYLKIEGPQINFYQTKTNKLLWFIPRPKMYEKNNPSGYVYGINLEFKCIDDVKDFEEKIKPLPECHTLILINSLNSDGKKWLSDSNRNYPIVIDPDFQIDNGDTASNWVSSDPSNFTVSQETTIKHEGTGSVKVTANNSDCWSTDGSTCNSACTYGGRSTTTTYTTCTSTVCSSTGNCWGTGGSCNSACTSASYNAYSLNTACSNVSSCH